MSDFGHDLAAAANKNLNHLSYSFVVVFSTRICCQIDTVYFCELFWWRRYILHPRTSSIYEGVKVRYSNEDDKRISKSEIL